jgi:hypothetical protein
MMSIDPVPLHWVRTNELPPACHGFARRLAPLRRPGEEIMRITGEAVLYKVLSQYLTAAVTELDVAILLSLVTILKDRGARDGRSESSIPKESRVSQLN